METQEKKKMFRYNKEKATKGKWLVNYIENKVRAKLHAHIFYLLTQCQFLTDLTVNAVYFKSKARYQKTIELHLKFTIILCVLV